MRIILFIICGLYIQLSSAQLQLDTIRLNVGLTRMYYSDTFYVKSDQLQNKEITQITGYISNNFKLNRTLNDTLEFIYSPVLKPFGNYETMRLTLESKKTNYLLIAIINFHVVKPASGSSGIFQEQQQKPIKLLFDSTSFNSDSVKSGQPLVYRFKIRNTDTLTLDIKPQTKCSCKGFKYSSNTIKPGETISVEIYYDTDGQSGDFSKTEFIEIGHQVYSLKFNAYIKPK